MKRLCTALSVLFLLTVPLSAGEVALLETEAAPVLLDPLPALELHSRSAVLIDAATGAVLFAKNEDELIPPASLTKLMTIYIALNQVEAGLITLDDVVALPPETWGRNQPVGSSLMRLASGHTVTLRELILGMTIPSGNDAAVAAALHCAPSVDAFATLMNDEAQKLGLTKLHFVEPSGISEFNLVTALEFAFFCREYVQRYPYALAEFHTVPEFAYPKAENLPPPYRKNPGTVVQRNHNPLLGIFEGTDGLKTGYIDESGHNLALTAQRNGTRLIAITLGASSIRLRNEDGLALLTWGFEHFKTLHILLAPLPPVSIWKGALNKATVITVETELEFMVRAERGQELHWEMQVSEPLVAPLSAGSEVGELIVADSVGELRRIAIITHEEVEEGGFFKRLWDSIRLFFRRIKQKKSATTQL